MQSRIAGLMLGVLLLTGCQGATPMAPVGNVVAPGNTLSAESCRATLESYLREIEAHPEKYTEENLSAYPEMMQYGQNMAMCQEKGFLTPQDMMQVAEKVSMESPDESGQ